MTNEDLHERADALARQIMDTRREFRSELEERRRPPPRPGKYGDLSGAVPVSDLEGSHA